MLIVLVACVAEKQDRKCPAKDMYLGDFFRQWMAYAQSLKPDKIFILSGKYGLLDLEQVIEPYDVNLDTKTEQEVRFWADKVLDKLAKEADLQKDTFVIMANKTYKKHIETALGRVQEHPFRI